MPTYTLDEQDMFWSRWWSRCMYTK